MMHTIFCSVQVPPQHVEQYKEVNVKSGESVTLSCEVLGTPAPRVLWQIGTRIVANYPCECHTYCNNIITCVCLMQFLV